MQPGVKGLRSLLPDTASTRILSTSEILKNWTFFSLWELFEGIAVETRKIQCNMTARLFSGTSAARFALRSEGDKRKVRFQRFPREYRRRDGFIGHRLQESCMVQPHIQIAYGA